MDGSKGFMGGFHPFLWCSGFPDLIEGLIVKLRATDCALEISRMTPSRTGSLMRKAIMMTTEQKV